MGYFICSKNQNEPSKVAQLAKSHLIRGRIFSHVRPLYERAVSDLDPLRSLHRPAQAAHNLFIEGSYMTKNTATGHLALVQLSPEKIGNKNIFLIQFFKNSRHCRQILGLLGKG